MPGDKRDTESWGESEFGLGTGMIDETSRADRAIPAHQELWEIYAVPKTFDGSMLPGEPQPPETTPVPRLLPGESETDRS